MKGTKVHYCTSGYKKTLPYSEVMGIYSHSLHETDIWRCMWDWYFEVKPLNNEQKKFFSFFNYRRIEFLFVTFVARIRNVIQQNLQKNVMTEGKTAWTEKRLIYFVWYPLGENWWNILTWIKVLKNLRWKSRKSSFESLHANSTAIYCNSMHFKYNFTLLFD